LGDISIDDMLSRELNPVQGRVLDPHGTQVGTHEGAALYTLGQRHGFVLTSQTPDTPPHFVIAKDIVQNTITVSTERFPQGVSKTEVQIDYRNWIGKVPPGEYQARFRYRQKLIPATLGRDIILHEPHYVPQGQALVLYDGARCLGGGIISNATLRS
jgi:tRNA-specific 2-thiouridylase